VWVLFFLPLLYGCNKPTSLDYLDISEGEVTVAWYGITPGITTYDEVMSIMETHPKFDVSNENYPSIDELEDDKLWVNYYLRDLFSHVAFTFNAANVVETISLNVHGVAIKDLVEKFGYPDYIYTDKYFQHSLDEYNYSSSLIFEKYSVKASIDLAQSNDGLIMNESSTVNIIFIHEGNESVVDKSRMYIDRNQYINIDFDDYLYDWNGFGNVFTLYPRIILHDKDYE
jgi:hypothetical protein